MESSSVEGFRGDLKGLNQAREWLYKTPSQELKKVGEKCLQFALEQASCTPFYHARLKEKNPKNLLDFGALSKTNYFDNMGSNNFRSPNSAEIAHFFNTSGTTNGTKYEIPWGEIEYDKGFIETSILGMAMGKVDFGDRGLCLASDLGALGTAYKLAGQRVGVEMFFPDQSKLYEDENLKKTFEEMKRLKTNLLIGAPGVLYQFTQRLIEKGFNLKELKIKTII